MAGLCLLLLLAGTLLRAPLGGAEKLRPGAKPHGPPTPPAEEQKDPFSAHWSYGEQIYWKADFPACAGKAQSPINIEMSTTTFDPQLQPIVLSEHVPFKDELRLSNNGHTVILELSEGPTMTVGMKDYQVGQLHFHWGSSDLPGSEHTINGARYPAELHVVFFSSKYKGLRVAMDRPGGLAVLAAFIETGPVDNPAYTELLSHFGQVTVAGQETYIPDFDISGLLPKRMDRYFRYNGSLTTPPCFQSVNWTVFNDTIKVSLDQLLILEETINGDDLKLLQLNYRDMQRLNGRSVFSSFKGPTASRTRPTPGIVNVTAGPPAKAVSRAPLTTTSAAKPIGAPEKDNTSAPVAPEPVAPAPVAHAPVAPEPVAPAPVAPEPVAPAPVAPEPVAPAPVAPEPVAPAPVAPEPVAPAPVTPAADGKPAKNMSSTTPAGGPPAGQQHSTAQARVQLATASPTHRLEPAGGIAAPGPLPTPGGVPSEDETGGDQEDEDTEGEDSVEDSSQTPDSRVIIPQDMEEHEPRRAVTLSTGDMLAIIFAVLFAFTAGIFFLYVKSQRKKMRRMKSEGKPTVIYRAATADDHVS